jgi:predicted DNA-binding transcriptional regulator AlpA
MEVNIMEGTNTGELLKKPYLTETEVAAITGRAVSTLRNERFLRRGFPYLRIGKRSIRYKTVDITAAMESRRIAFDD